MLNKIAKKDILYYRKDENMNFGMETEMIEYKKTTGELKEGIISLASMLNKVFHPLQL